MSADPDAAAPGESPSGSIPGAVPASTNGVDVPTPPSASAVVSPGGTARPKRAAATNARDLLSGKREREGFFDAEDDARAKAAAKRAAAAAEKLRAEEELIARWREEDRLKQQQRREERRQKSDAAGEDADGEDANVSDAPAGANGIDGEPKDDDVARGEDGAELGAARTDEAQDDASREQYDANGDVIVGTTGRSKKNRPPDAETRLVPPPAPPAPTVAFEPPLREARGVPCFGCTSCGYSRHGCDACLKGPRVRSCYAPEAAIHHDVPPVPTFYPTEQEWAGDPLEYINAIRPEAEKYGCCNIVAPPSWQPEFRLPNGDDLRFRTRVQAVTELQNRPAGPSKRARENEAKARAALEAAGLAVPPGFALGGNAGGRMGGGGSRPNAPAPAPAPAPGTPPDEREGSAEASGLEASGVPRALPPKPAVTADDARATAILAQYGFIPGERHTRASLERYSRYFRKKYFSRDGVPADVTVRDLEGEFWRLVESPELGKEVEVIYGADIATLEVGSGFTAKDDDCLDAPDQRKYATSPWNVCNMPYNPSSCLKHVEATTGITVPWLYFGMTLSTFCWHVEDHHFYSVNYHHFGDPKVWYSIPAKYSARFEEVMRRRLPHLFAAQPDLLHSLVTILSPAVLKEEGIPVYRAEQHPRSYIITFPHAYHAGFNTGFNCAEAVNFAPVDWLPFGAVATEQYVRDKRYQSVAHDQLLATLCDAAEQKPSFCPTVAKVMAERVQIERERRDAALKRVAKTARMAGTDLAPDLFEKDCAVCQADLNWAGVRCECKPKKLYCLRCVRECACKPERSTLFFRHTAEELDAKCARLAELARRHEDAEAAARAAAPVTTVAEEWIACDACGKWRRVPASLVAALGEDQKWTCVSNPRPAFASCDAPEEKMRENETWDEQAS